jgi:hypothetical protein
MCIREFLDEDYARFFAFFVVFFAFFFAAIVFFTNNYF